MNNCCMVNEIRMFSDEKERDIISVVICLLLSLVKSIIFLKKNCSILGILFTIRILPLNLKEILHFDDSSG